MTRIELTKRRMNFSRLSRSLLLFSILICQQTLSASHSYQEDRVLAKQWEFELALGYAGIENPLVRRNSAKSFVLPQWRYYSERFYIDNVSLGYSLLEDEKYFVDLFTYLNDDGIFYNADDHDLTFLEVRKFVPIRLPVMRIEPPEIKRDLSYMAGIKGNLDLEWFETKITLAQDIAAGHHGKEATFSIGDTVHIQNFNLYLEAGVVFKSKELINYYYQLKADEILSRRMGPVIADRWLANPYFKIAGTYKLSENWSAVLSMSQHWLHDDIADSFLVEEETYLSGFIGINYAF